MKPRGGTRSRMTSTANVQDHLKISFSHPRRQERDEKRRIAAEAAGDTKLAEEIALWDASYIEMEKSEDIERCAKRCQRDGEQLRLQEAADQDDGRDRVPRHVPEPDTNSEIDLTRHNTFYGG